MMVPQLFLCNYVFPDSITTLHLVEEKKIKKGKKIREDVEIKVIV